jgi:hypothetical protein
MGPVREIVWHSPLLHSLEIFELGPGGDGGWSLRGLAAVGGSPGHIRYRVEADPAWETTLVEIDVAREDDARTLRLTRDDGGWIVDGSPRPDLRECRDVDLGWTPATNTLPIRRLGLEVGTSRSIQVAWVRFPEYSVEVSEQTYTRLAVRSWRYRSGPYDFHLEVDADGLVTRYGAVENGLWRAVAAH